MKYSMPQEIRSQHRRSYFISDVHLLSPALRAQTVSEKKLAAFFDHLKDQECALYLVGDIFDFWFEYRTVVPRQCLFGIIELLKLRDYGVEVHYLAGNHDGWLGAFAQKELDIQIYTRPLILDLGGQKTLVLHGDGVSGKDFFYRKLRRVLRHPVNVWLYRWLHPDLGIPLANMSSRRSKRSDPEYRRYANDTTLEKYFNLWFSRGIQTIIMGHHHLPTDSRLSKGRYINLGDWTTHYTYAVYDNHEIRLCTWNEESTC